MIKFVKKLIRKLKGPYVDLDAFSSSQIASKAWLAERLESALEPIEPPAGGFRVWIYGGWYGITNLVLRVRGVLPIAYVRSIDVDPDCETVADKINKFWEIQQWAFKALTADVNRVAFELDPPHMIINTSTEHMTSRAWFDNIVSGTIVALQGSDLPHDDHVAVYDNLEAFAAAFPLSNELYRGAIEFNYPTHSFRRWMVIGLK
jgi:hypothetical protein